MIYLTFDTSYIVSTCFNFDNNFFKYLEEYILNGTVKIVISSIVDKEIERHLLEQTRDSASTINKCASRVRCLANDGTFSNKLDLNFLSRIALNKFDGFKEKFGIIAIDLNGVNADSVFSDYFSGVGAFESKDKKNEFPDAFAIDSIINYSKDNKLFILSNDNDWLSHTMLRGGVIITDDEEVVKNSNIVFSKSHEHILSMLASITGKDNEECESYFKANFNSMFDNDIEKDFSEQLSSFRYSYYDIEVTNSNILSMELDKALIIRKDKDAKSIVVAILYHIESCQDVNYRDYDNGCWDSEEKEYVFVPSVYSTIHYKTNGLLIVEAEYEYKSGKLEINNPRITNNEISLTDSDYVREEESYPDDFDDDYYEEMKLRELEEKEKAEGRK
ncbi:DUF4935 domain-containing protein [bacterium]|nr:DUF4935 domain-containing protein [bacterium]